MTSFRFGSATDTGRIRNSNQDSMLLRDTLFAVADGMGGHQGGEVASAMAVETLSRLTTDPSPDSLLTGVNQANHDIFDRSRKDSELRGMGTTLCAVALVNAGEDEELAVINVGDSRVYQFRDGDLVQLTRDHSLVEDLRQEGRITDAEAAVHPQRNIVTRALGIAPRVDVDEFSVIPRTGDRYLLCSDGLFNEVTPDRIGATLRRLVDPDEAAQELVRLANENGGRDNITCVIVDIADDDGRADRAVEAGTELISTRAKRAPDLAGFSTAGEVQTPDAPTPEPDEPPRSQTRTIRRAEARAAAQAAKEEKAAQPKPRTFTWRTALFLVLCTAVVGAVIAALAWYGRGAYYVGYDSTDSVAIFQGRPGGFLWFRPTLVERTGVSHSQVPGEFIDGVDNGKIWSTRSDAERYVTNIQSVICEQADSSTTVTSTTLPGTLTGPATTLPAQCRKAATPTTEPPSPTTLRRAPPTTVRRASPTPTTTRRTP